VGSVSSDVPVPYETDVTVKVAQTLKGPSTASVVVAQGDALVPGFGTAGAVIQEIPGEPLLLPGDQVVLLLQSASDGTYLIQNISGLYQVVGGKVQPDSLNPWASTSISGETESQFVSQLRAAIGG
jgi:hypothetical protein